MLSVLNSRLSSACPPQRGQVQVLPAALRHPVGCGELLHRAGLPRTLRRSRRLPGPALPVRPGLHRTKLLRQRRSQGPCLPGCQIRSVRATCVTHKFLFFSPFILQASLKERFDWDGAAGPQWQVLEGGRPCTDCGVLVEGTALYFGGADARQAVTADLDLRGAK